MMRGGHFDRRRLSAILAAAPLAHALAGCATKTPAAAQPIEEGAFVSINGVEQWISIRGKDIRNPILLYLQGGPGIGATFMAPVFFDWEADFTVVLWDQPGGGCTDLKNLDNPGEQTLDRYAKDAIAVAEHVRARLGQERLIVFGNSWGTQLGVEFIHRRPDLVSAYVGVAQACGRRGWLLGYQLAIEAARARGDTAAVEALERVGPPPYARFEDFMVRQTYAIPPGQPASEAENVANAAFAAAVFAPPPQGASWMAPIPPPAGYDFGAVFLRSARAMLPVWQEMEIRDYGSAYDIPMFVFQGEQDINTPPSLAREWIEEISAPAKAFELISGASHNVMPFHQHIHGLMRRHVIPSVRGGARG
jgi:pimeloyl-ACP methyl ester carboxylesterase